MGNGPAGLGSTRKVVALQVELAGSGKMLERVGLEPCSVRGMQSNRMRRALKVHRLLLRYINVVMLREPPGRRKSNKLRRLGGEVITVSAFIYRVCTCAYRVCPSSRVILTHHSPRITPHVPPSTYHSSRTTLHVPFPGTERGELRRRCHAVLSLPGVRSAAAVKRF